ncbi:MAG TPA: fatty acid desaturase [Kofleriaceae bacterium]|nr:fatty acid desaturase [Kofleriaceae bacterium]
MELRPIASYAQAVRPTLPDAVFEPARSRLLWLPVHVTVIAGIAWALAAGHVPAPLWPVASLVIGVCMSAVAFLGHETLHGAVVRGRLAIRVVGWICLLPFTCSPTLWTAWHNRVHHNQCAKPGADPDMYPTLSEYETQPAMRIMADYFGLGGRRLSSVFSLLLGFTGQSQQMLWEARKHGFLDGPRYMRAIGELVLGVGFWTAVALLIGFVPFAFVYLLPLIVANVVVMSFIMTNHNLSSLTPTVNDPLVNSLSVTLPRPLEWLSLDFGYHVEHHVFPTMSARHGRRVREALRAQFPDHYQSMPLPRALGQLWRTGRVYQDNTTLIDPRTGRTAPTLQPRRDASL